MKTYTDYYTQESLELFRRKKAVFGAFLAVLAAAGLFACIFMLSGITTQTAPRTLAAVLIVNGAVGTAVIFLFYHVYSPLKKEYDHMLSMTSEPREKASGILHLLPGKTIILTSITVRDVTLDTGSEVLKLLVSARIAPKLAEADGTRVTVETVHRYILSVEGVVE